MTRTETATSTPTFTITATWSITATFTISPTPLGVNKVEISIYDANGEVVRKLADGRSNTIVHFIGYSSNPYMVNGSNLLIIRDTLGQQIGSWDGDNSGGTSVYSGTYTVHVETTDNAGNKYVLDTPIDVLTSNSLLVNNLTVRYLPGAVRIVADLSNAQWAEVKIYNINSELVKRFRVEPANALDITWDTKTTSGQKAARGIYVAVIEIKDANTGYIGRRMEKIALR